MTRLTCAHGVRSVRRVRHEQNPDTPVLSGKVAAEGDFTLVLALSRLLA